MTDGATVRHERRFSATEAAFAGFRLARREPLTLAIWAAVLAVFGLVFGSLMVLMAGPAMMDLRNLQPGASKDPAAVLSVFQKLGPFYALTFPVTLLFYAVAYGAVNRAVLRPSTPPRFGRLAVGGDELRQLLVLVLLGLLFFALYIVTAIVAIVAAVALGIAAQSAGGVVVGILVGVVAGLTVVGVFLFVAVRLSLASPLTFDTERVSIFASWRLTKGRFWALLGAYLLSGVMVLLLSVVALVVTAVIATVVGGGLSAAGVIFRPDMTSLATYFTPVSVVWMVIAACLNSLTLALTIGAPAAAYAQLRELEQPLVPTTGF